MDESHGCNSPRYLDNSLTALYVHALMMQTSVHETITFLNISVSIAKLLNPPQILTDKPLFILSTASGCGIVV